MPWLKPHNAAIAPDDWGAKHMEKNLDCTVIGDAFVDIVIPINSFGQFSAALEGGVLNAECLISPGGTANVAVGLATLGSTTAFIGKVGDDCFGSLFTRDLEDATVLSRVSVSKTRKTGLAITLSSMLDAERFFIVERGANTELSSSDLDYYLANASDFVYFTGFSLQDTGVSKAVLSFIEQASKEGNKIVFNPGAHNIVTALRATVIEAVERYADVVILNYSEGSSLAQDGRDKQITEFLLSLGVSAVALTKGKKGSLVATRRGTCVVKAAPTEIKDSIGAGDAFAAGFIHGIAKGWKWEKAGSFASLAARAVVCHNGPRCDFRNVQLM